MAGFAHAPITKFLCIAVTSASVLVQSAGVRSHGGWKDWPHIFLFQTPGELVFGTLLLFYTRIFERRRGSTRHAEHLLSCTTASLAFQWLLCAILRVSLLPSFPQIVFFSNLAPFLVDVPPLSQFQVAGKTMTDKTFLLLAVAEYLYIARHRSVLPAICAFAAGILHRAKCPGMRSLRVPAGIARTFSSTLGRLLHSPPPQHVRPAASRADSGPSSPQPPPGAVPPGAIAQLREMGFSEREAERALILSGGDERTALAILLGDHQ
mmetsp:Transcript_914/g.2180  ORF Transcript_914/g.2180 Transcript_914/m.2180 type:complete len:265 (+) Transcript_914:57-851(+)